MPPSPALPWEVIERTIDHSAHSIKALYSFTLTCRDLCPRSTMHLYRHVKLKDRDQLFALCANLQAKPHLQLYVRSVKIPTPEFSPHPLFRILPNLSEIEFGNHVPQEYNERPAFAVPLHPSVLKNCRLFGTNIRTLSLMNIKFSSPSTFSDILLSFPKIQALSCKNLDIENDSVNWELIAQRLSVRLHDFRSMTVDQSVKDPILALLHVAAKHRVTTFSYMAEQYHKPSNLTEFLVSPSDWVQLNSLTWQALWYTADYFETMIQHTIDILESFHPPKLQDVAINFNLLSWVDLVNMLPVPELCAKLENVLLVFPRPTIVFSSVQPLNDRLHHSQMSICQRFFPGLEKLGSLKIDTEYSGIAGHDGELSAPIIISDDSRWAATGSEDGTIIIWEIETGCISQEWFTGYATVGSLAFSPDSRYIVSTSWHAAVRGVGATVWDLYEGAHKGRPLMVEEYDDGDSPPTNTIQCAWSPDGGCIVAGPQSDGATHIWEATTFQPLHSHGSPWMGELLAFSPNGRWVATAITDDNVSQSWSNLDGKVLSPGKCWIWDVESGELHRTLHHGLGPLVKSAAFDPGSSRIVTVTGYNHDSIQIWDIETEQQLVIMEVEEAKKAGLSSRLPTNVVVFSGDGRMVLTYNGVKYDSPGAAVWDSFDGAMLAFFSELNSNGIDPHTACLSPCGSLVAFACWYGAVHLWRTSDWSCIAKVSVSEMEVTHVAISPDGQVLCWGNIVGQVFFRRIHDLVAANED